MATKFQVQQICAEGYLSVLPGRGASSDWGLYSRHRGLPSYPKPCCLNATFLLHRITNDRDQELISRLVPDNTRGLLRELPSLPTRHCILMGIASKVPALVEVKHLEDGQRPESDDPDFWNVWTNKEACPIDWDKIANDWIGAGADDESSQKDGNTQ